MRAKAFYQRSPSWIRNRSKPARSRHSKREATTAAKKVKGRKRVLVTDSLGLIIDAGVVIANMHDTKTSQHVFAKISSGTAPAKTIKAVFADKGFLGSTLAGWLKAQMSAAIYVTASLAKIAKVFIPAKKRWVVERSFAGISDYYRLSVDRERLTRNSLAMLRLASIRLMLRRLHPVEREWPCGHRLE